MSTSNENQQPQTAIAPVAQLRNFLSSDNVKKRFEEILGKRAGAFTNSIVNVYRNNAALQKCTPDSVASAALVAATMNLPIDPALGQAAIVPYGNKAQFQIMYKGVTQLCIRSNQYATIHCSEVYGDELLSHNPITGEVKFKDPAKYEMRYKDKNLNVVGHFAYFKLLSGFEKSDFMTTAEALAHGKKFSKSYQYDLRDKKKTSRWSLDPIPMCNKTVLLRLLTKYGVMSIEMQEAILADSDTFEASQTIAAERKAAETGSEPIDASFENQEQPEQTGDEQPKTTGARPKFLDFDPHSITNQGQGE